MKSHWSRKCIYFVVTSFWILNLCSSKENGDSDSYEAEGDFPSSFGDTDLDVNDVEPYLWSLGERTLGMGVTLAIVLGVLNFCVCICCCCRVGYCRICKKKSCCTCLCDKLQDYRLTEEYEDDVIYQRTRQDRKTTCGEKAGGLLCMHSKELKQKEGFFSGMRGMHFFWLFWVIFTLMSYISAGMSYQHATDAQETLSSGFDEVTDLMTETAEFLCIDYKMGDTGAECDGSSVGEFLYITKEYVFDLFDSAIDVLNTVEPTYDANVVVFESTQNGPGIIDGSKATVELIDSTLTSIQDDYSFFDDPDNVGGLDLSGSLPSDDDLPEVTDDDIAEFDDAAVDMDELVSAVNASVVATRRAKEEAAELIVQLDDTSSEATTDSNYRQDFNEEFLGMIGDIQTIQHDALDLKDDIADAKNRVFADIDQNSSGVAFFMFIPGLFIIVTGLISYILKKKIPLGCTMCTFFWCQGIYCVIAGAFLVFSVFSSDICDNHKLIINNIFDGTSIDVVNLEEGQTLGDVMIDVFYCPDDADGTTPDNNLLDIFNAKSELNVTSDIMEVVRDLQDEKAQLLDGLESMETAMVELYAVANISFAIGSDQFNSSDYIAQLNAIKRNRLAPYPFSRRDEDHQQSLYDIYSDYGLGNSFTWENYALLVNNTNDALEAMVVVPEPWNSIRPFGFKTIVNFTVSVVNSTTGVFYISSSDGDLTANAEDGSGNYAQYSSYASYTALTSAVAAVQAVTGVVEEIISDNSQAVKKINSMIASIGELDQQLQDFADYETELDSWVLSMDKSFTNLTAAIEDQLDGMDELEGLVRGIQDVLYTASDYLHCAFIGDFFRDFFLDIWCVDLVDQTYSMGQAATSVAVTMFLAHFFIGAYWPTLYGLSKGDSKSQTIQRPNFYAN